jgi:hypothetical protein
MLLIIEYTFFHEVRAYKIEKNKKGSRSEEGSIKGNVSSDFFRIRTAPCTVHMHLPVTA